MKNRTVVLIFSLLIIFSILISAVSAKDYQEGNLTKIGMKNREVSTKTSDNDLNSLKNHNSKIIEKKVNKNNTKKYIKKDSKKNDSEDYIIKTTYKKLTTQSYGLYATVENRNAKKVNGGTLRFYQNSISNNIVNDTVLNGTVSTIYTFKNYPKNVKIFADYETPNGYITNFSNAVRFNVTPIDIDIKLKYPYELDMNKKLIVKATIKDHGKFVKNRGNVILFLDNVKRSTKKPSDSKVQFNLGKQKMGKHKITVRYVNNYEEQYDYVVSTDITRKKEQISVNLLTDDNKITIKAFISNGTEKLNKGHVNLKLNNKIISTKAVKRGLVTFTKVLPQKVRTYKFKLQYVKSKILATKTLVLKVKLQKSGNSGTMVFYEVSY